MIKEVALLARKILTVLRYWSVSGSMSRLTKEERRKYEIYRELEEFASEMNYLVDAVIVEGPHDKKTLQLLGYKKSILPCSQLAPYELAEMVSKKFTNVAIFTDFDEEGTRLNKKLSQLFEQSDVKVNPLYRKRLQKLLQKARVSTIEGIYRIKRDLFS